MENSILVFGVDLLRVHGNRKCERPRETAVEALGPVEILRLHLFLALPLTAERENVVLDLDIDVVLFHAGKLRLHHDVVPFLIDVAKGCPRSQSIVSSETRHGAVLKDPIDAVLKRLEILDEGLKSDECHLFSSLRNRAVDVP